MRQPPTTSQWKVALSFFASLYGTLIFGLLCVAAYFVHAGVEQYQPFGVWWKVFTVRWYLTGLSIAMMVWGWPVFIKQLRWHEEYSAELREQFSQGKESS